MSTIRRMITYYAHCRNYSPSFQILTDRFMPHHLVWTAKIGNERFWGSAALFGSFEERLEQAATELEFADDQLSNKAIFTFIGGVTRHLNKEQKKAKMRTHYEEKIASAFRHACEENKKKDGQAAASPEDVTRVLRERGDIAALDTVIDIADLMRDLNDRGLLA